MPAGKTLFYVEHSLLAQCNFLNVQDRCAKQGDFQLTTRVLCIPAEKNDGLRIRGY